MRAALAWLAARCLPCGLRLGSGFFHDLLLLGSLLGSFLFCQLGLCGVPAARDLLRGPALTLFHFLLARRDARFARFFNRLVFGRAAAVSAAFFAVLSFLFLGAVFGSSALVSAAGAGCGATGFSGSAVALGIALPPLRAPDRTPRR